MCSVPSVSAHAERGRAGQASEESRTDFVTDISASPLSAASAHGLKILFQHHLVHVTPAPVLARLDRLHDGMMRTMKMFCRMLILRRIAAAYVTATEAQSEMDPGVAHFHTFLASR